jgi:hypothetical protein
MESHLKDKLILSPGDGCHVLWAEAVLMDSGEA